MIAPKTLPKNFKIWNKKYGAPFGRPLFKSPRLKKLLPWKLYRKYAGPFFLQPNNTTREFEYPWAFYATPIMAGQRILEIGGGLSGFQFVLDKLGCKVINVDPGQDAATSKGWPSPGTSTMATLNHLFGTSVELRNTIVKYANFELQSFDRIFSISVVEHLPDEEIEDIMSITFDCLKPGGYFILTVDLFLNIVPFASQQTNQYGKNINVKHLVEIAPFVLVQGNRFELNGYPEFNSDKIQNNLKTYYIGRKYPTLIQCIVLQKQG